MSTLEHIIFQPFLWVGEPISAFWLGSATLALIALAMGQVTAKVALAVNGSHLDRHVADAQSYENTYLEMLKQGEAEHRSGVNQLANEAFGKAFFMGIAISAASLWPLFLAAGWIDARFAGIRLPIAGLNTSLSNIAPLIIAYIVFYILFVKMGKMMRKFRTSRADTSGKRGDR